MLAVCLCPTYHRPALLANAVACFLAQDYTPRLLAILDDAGQYPPSSHIVSSTTGLHDVQWSLFSESTRYPSIPAKYARLLHLLHLDAAPLNDVAICVWDDDDIYGPRHISASLAAMQRQLTNWSHPDHVWSTYTGTPQLEPAAGRFHGALVIRHDLLWEIGGPEGWIQTKRADFDQQSIAACEDLGGPRGRCTPEYVYGWGRTHHCSGLMSSPDNTDWYDRYPDTIPPEARAPQTSLVPQMDAQTVRLYRDLFRT